jgi:2-polyprenyl-3-methyl-5-hydroxy-6-metoxy-1,4-benzoquinol methylase
MNLTFYQRTKDKHGMNVFLPPVTVHELNMEINAFKMYHPKEEVEAAETHGQCWRGDTIEDGLKLCAFQTIEPVFDQYLPREGKILEAGCGTGRWVFCLRRKGYDVLGIDLARDAVAAAYAYDPTAPIILDDAKKTRFQDGYFRAVISLGVVEHFEEGPYQALQEVRRLLSNDGLFLLSVPIQNMFRLLLINHLKRLKMRLRKLWGHQYVFEEYRYTRKQMTKILQGTGFEIITIVPDEYIFPKSMGLFVDLPFLRHKTNKWEMNPIGKVIQKVFHAISAWFAASSALWVCRVKH